MAPNIDRSLEANKENITLICFDSDLGIKVETADRMNILRAINDYVLVYNNMEECISYIKSVKNEKILLVTSGIWASVLLPPIIHLKQLSLVFIFCNWREEHLYLMEKFPKIVGVFNEEEKLDSSIRENLHLCGKQVEVFNFYDKKEKFAVDLSERAVEFLWFQLFIDIILRLPADDDAKKQMINACRDYYRGNNSVLRSIDEFEKCYKSQECIQWYTRETFVYKMVNKALRTQDIQQLHTFRFFIVDLSTALAKEHKKMIEEFGDETSATFFRGTRLTLLELEEFKANVGKLISINGYLSTSRSRSIATKFAATIDKQVDSVPVLFVIECQHIDDDSCVFADIAKFSNFPNEQEILFNLDSVFIVKAVDKDGDTWRICLTTTTEGREISKRYIEQMNREMEGNSVQIIFGSLLTRMGHYQSAQVYFKKLLKVSINEDLACTHNQLGLIHHAKAEFDEALHQFEIASQMIKELHPPPSRGVAQVLRNMSHVFKEQGYYEKAFKFCNEAKDMLEKMNDSCQLETAHCLHSMGAICRDMGKYLEALSYYEETWNIQQSYLPENHIYIAKTLNSIGVVHYVTKNFEKAFNFYSASLQMYEACLPENHVDIANVHHNLGDYYYSKHEYDKALQVYSFALSMKIKCLPQGHLSLALTLNSISVVHMVKRNFAKALELCLQALKIRERALPVNHPDLAESCSTAGQIYEAMKDNKRALEYFQKSLAIREKNLLEDDPLLKTTRRYVACMKWEQK